jgi:hypothetical protein
MAQGTAQGKVKIANPADLQDKSVPDILNAIYSALYAQNLLLRAMALDQGCDLPDELDELIEEVI